MGTSGTNEDDLTVKLADIIYINRFIADMCSKGAASSVILENWDFLQQQVCSHHEFVLVAYLNSV
jgi:DNA-directed RNA polymerase III subunit RPC1